MLLLASGRIFAEHYQFIVFDSATNPFDNDFPDWNEQSSKLGYCARANAVFVGTVAHLNDHWVEVWLSEKSPNLDPAERVVALPFKVLSGAVFINNIMDIGYEDGIRFSLEPGHYTLYVLAYNLGKDQFEVDGFESDPDDDQPLSDQELAAREDLERYKLIFVSGKTERVGVINGSLPL